MEKKDLFSDLPPEITIEILSRLPIRSAMECKLVNKSWLSLIESAEFVRTYKPFPCLAVFEGMEGTRSHQYNVYEVGEEVKYSDNSCKKVVNFTIPNPEPIPMHSSANGLLFLFYRFMLCRKLVVCNPVTREYINLPIPRVCDTERWYQCDSYGFGVSKRSGQYKLVRVFHQRYKKKWTKDITTLYCQLYTLGTGSWRSINVPNSRSIVFGDNMIGASMHGNFHWFAHDIEGRPRISCFDLETEVFTTLSPPTGLDHGPRRNHRTMSILRGCLGLCDSSSECEIVIWLMKEYGDERSWTKQLVIPKRIGQCGYYRYALICAVKLFEDGDVLLAQTPGSSYSYVLCYSNKTKTFRKANLIESRDITIVSSTVCYTPSFLHLRTSFPMEDVISL